MDSAGHELKSFPGTRAVLDLWVREGRIEVQLAHNLISEVWDDIRVDGLTRENVYEELKKT